MKRRALYLLLLATVMMTFDIGSRQSGLHAEPTVGEFYAEIPLQAEAFFGNNPELLARAQRRIQGVTLTTFPDGTYRLLLPDPESGAVIGHRGRFQAVPERVAVVFQPDDPELAKFALIYEPRDGGYLRYQAPRDLYQSSVVYRKRDGSRRN